MPSITVILPCYNGANYLREAVDSVLAQTFADFELHILDDGSTDASPAIAAEYAAADSRIRYSRNSGRFGLMKTLNRGCREATADWVRLWAHDDRMPPNGLARFHEFAVAHPNVGMVYCDFFDMNGEGRLTGAERIYQPQRDRTPEVADADTSVLLFLAFGCLPGNISTVMLNRRAWAESGGFIEGMQHAPDYEMWLRLSERHPVGFIRDKLVELRAHPLQLSREGQKQLTTMEEMRVVYDHLSRRLVPAIMSEGEFRRYWRSCQGRGQMHLVAKCAVRGEVRLSWRGLQSIARYGMPVRQFINWLVSANGKLWPTNGAAFFDRMAARLPTVQAPRVFQPQSD